jgi:hypothetical protein
MDSRSVLPVLACLLAQIVSLGQISTPEPRRTNSVTKTKEYLSTTILNAETREFKPGDSFLYAVKEDPTKGGQAIHTVRVSDAGEAIFPVSFGSKLYVKVDVRSMKLGDIRQKVKSLLDEDYYNDSTVLLEFTQANRSPTEQEISPQVQIYGEMQGVVVLRENEVKRISDAMLSLNRSPYADLRRVRLHRIDPTTGKEEIKTINVDKILREGDRSIDEILQDGDRIEVRPKTFQF